jgi:signal transduction histidine kinase
MEIKRSHAVAAAGWLMNLTYWSYETWKRGPGRLPEHILEARLEHLVILSSIPLFMLAGYLIYTLEEEMTRRRRAEEEAHRHSDLQAAVNHLLQLPLGDISLEEMLERAIEEIVSIPRLSLKSVGGIFLVEDDPEVLVLKAQRGLHPSLLTECAVVPFGRCLCGRAAASGKTLYAGEVTEKHETRYEGMSPHGHYCVPILAAGRVLGVINLYVGQGHRRDRGEEEFLQGIANVLAGIIERKRAEDRVRSYAKELEEANGMKDLFIDIMRHELLNPAGCVKNASDILLDDETDVKKREVLDMIKRQSLRLIEMIQSASQFSKLQETDRVECDIQDLNALLKESVLEFKPQLESAGIGVVYRLEGQNWARVNPLLRDVFSNLLSNAIKYAPEGKKIEVGILDKGKSWEAYVKDWGRGISEENRERLFNRFERLGKEGVKGTGLGLAIAKRIVELHGGDIWVEDNPEGGSIFWVRLPKDVEKQNNGSDLR